MSIIPIQDPTEARELARTVLRSGPPGGGGELLSLADAPAPELGALEIYNMTPDAVMRRDWESAVPTGWRYVQVSPGAEVGDIVEIRTHNEPEPAFASRSSGRLAGRIETAANAAAAELAQADPDFEPRVLRMPEIHMEALWLRAPDPAVADRFYGLPSSQSELRDEEFVATAMSRAETYVRTTEGDDGPQPTTAA